MDKPKFLDRIMTEWKPEFVISSGSYLLDNSPALKAFKGIPSGSIVQLMSKGEGSFKTSTALAGLASIQALGHKVAFVDVEAALSDTSWVHNFGIDTEKNWSLAIPESGEEACDMVEYFLDQGYKGIVVDSVDGMQPSSILTSEYGDAHIGNHAKLVTAFVRRLKNLVVKHNAIVYLINHLKVNMTQMGARGHKATGGSAIMFYSKLNIELSRKSDNALKGEDVIPITIGVKRSKFGDSFIDIDTFAVQGRGIDSASELVLIAKDKGLIKKSGAWWKTGDDDVIGQGITAAREWVIDNIDKIHEERKDTRESEKTGES